MMATLGKNGIVWPKTTDDDDLVSEHHTEVGLGQHEVDRVEQGAGPHGGNGGLEGLAVPRPA